MPGRTVNARLAPVRVLDLELTAPLEPLTGLERYVEVQALVRRAGAPVGWLTLPVIAGQVSREAVQAALDPSWMRPEVKERRPLGPLPSVTVAVCTRDRPDDLARCLEALGKLDPPGAELLVIDNAPTTDGSERVVRTLHPRVRYVREPEPGLDHARNRAIVEATGEVLAFTDDDVIVDPGWVAALAAAFAGDPEVLAATGLVVPWELETEAQVLFERYRSFARGFVPERVQADPSRERVGWRYGNTGRFGTGANMAFRRDAFRRVGLFDPVLGAGSVARGGDDLEMLFRMLKAGGALHYEPRAIVRHRHRREPSELQAQMRDSGSGFSAALVRSARAHRDERAALARLWCWWAAKLLYRSIRPSGHPPAALRELALAELSGVLHGLRLYRRSSATGQPVAATLTPA